MKKVFAYLHTHWDREWYREFEIFRLRLLRVFDNVLNLLETDKIPSFYFDGHTCALEDYLELRPEKFELVKSLISQKKLFIGPFYTLVDEFLTDEDCFRKNLEIGLKYAKSLGCTDFIAYFADTFGHTQAAPLIVKEYGIDKAIVWRGCPKTLPAEFIFNGINTVNLIRGYFNNIFSEPISIEKKAKFLQSHLDKIAEKSGDILLMPIGADHLGVEPDIADQIVAVNKLLNGYQIQLTSPFEYFNSVDFTTIHNDELRDNSQTFILQGSYSARADIKRYSAKASRLLKTASKLVSDRKIATYDTAIEYAYKLMIKNLAHDSMYGCSTDDVHEENITRYKKIIQIAQSIIKEITLNFGENEISEPDFKGVLQYESYQDKDSVSVKTSVGDEILYDTQRIPITEDFTNVYTCVKPFNLPYESDLEITSSKISNSKIALELKADGIIVTDKVQNKVYKNFLTFIDYKDLGDTYNFAPDINDKGNIASIVSSSIKVQNQTRCELEITLKLGLEDLTLTVGLNKYSHLLNFRLDWQNKHKNHLLQAKFNLPKNVTSVNAQSMGYLFERLHDPYYDMRKNLPQSRGLEAVTNFAPFQKYLNCQEIEFITDGIFEYETFENSLSLTLLRSTGIISNPKNPARTTPAGPPIIVKKAQLLGENSASFNIGFAPTTNRLSSLNEVFPTAVIQNQVL